MANIIDITDSLTIEGKEAQKYANMLKDSTDDDIKDILEDLKRYSLKKMKLLHKLIKEVPWVFDDED